MAFPSLSSSAVAAALTVLGKGEGERGEGITTIKCRFGLLGEGSSQFNRGRELG